MDAETLFYIRRTRAVPPGHAGEEERRGTYGMALEQFEELLAAAEAASPAVRPLPLFYALSQAGRAIAAAHLANGWTLRGHGLSCPDLAPASVLDLEIRPQRSNGADRLDSFHAVADAMASGTPAAPVTLGQLWMALPGLSRLLADAPGQWPEALHVELLDDVTSKLYLFDYVNAALLSYRHPYGEIADRLEMYPHGEVTIVDKAPNGDPLVLSTRSGVALSVRWPIGTHDALGRWATLARIAPSASGGERWWRPFVGGAAMNDLMVWWTILFSLSMLARYEPARWNAALDLDRAPLASHLIRLMDAAVDVVPWLVLQALEPDYEMMS